MGWGMISSDGRTNHVVEYGVIRANSKLPLAERLSIIFHELQDIIQRIKPEVMAVEEVFVGKNPRSALWIGHARAVALLTGAECRIPVSEYATRDVKLSVVGNGAASKQQVEFMVGTILGIENSIPHDASDALAVALCHAARSQKLTTGS
jgi:crossover junction endodeoxyribonuclease RuvC